MSRASAIATSMSSCRSLGPARSAPIKGRFRYRSGTLTGLEWRPRRKLVRSHRRSLPSNVRIRCDIGRQKCSARASRAQPLLSSRMTHDGNLDERLESARDAIAAAHAPERASPSPISRRSGAAKELIETVANAVRSSGLGGDSCANAWRTRPMDESPSAFRRVRRGGGRSRSASASPVRVLHGGDGWRAVGGQRRRAMVEIARCRGDPRYDATRQGRPLREGRPRLLARRFGAEGMRGLLRGFGHTRP